METFFIFLLDKQTIFCRVTWVQGQQRWTQRAMLYLNSFYTECPKGKEEREVEGERRWREK